jgi:hypothetical protein
MNVSATAGAGHSPRPHVVARPIRAIEEIPAESSKPVDVEAPTIEEGGTDTTGAQQELQSTLEGFHAAHLQSEATEANDDERESGDVREDVREIEHVVRRELRSIARDVRHLGRGEPGSNRENAHAARDINRVDRDFRHALRASPSETSETGSLDGATLVASLREAFENVVSGLADALGNTGELESEDGSPVSSVVGEVAEPSGEAGELTVDDAQTPSRSAAVGLEQRIGELRDVFESMLASIEETFVVPEDGEGTASGAELETAVTLYSETQPSTLDEAPGSRLDTAA